MNSITLNSSNITSKIDSDKSFPKYPSIDHLCNLISLCKPFSDSSKVHFENFWKTKQITLETSLDFPKFFESNRTTHHQSFMKLASHAGITDFVNSEKKVFEYIDSNMPIKYKNIFKTYHC